MKRQTEKTKLTVTIDKQMKKEFLQLCEDIGLPASAVVSALMSVFTRLERVYAEGGRRAQKTMGGVQSYARQNVCGSGEVICADYSGHRELGMTM